ncbi:MAG: hypothetical protein ING09_19870 [Roseomonas sp.]|jgi:hypothetical protein|nr:hypothetical protein [Roseomonas sp.]MCA3289270.1 hypothetical protein [Roseomonas sp.]MCA3296470.1 hypothetical protein [Roseomonas sp.]
MVEYAWPEALRPTRLTFYLQHNTTRFVSPITRQAQVLRREGARWVARRISGSSSLSLGSR